MFLIPFASFSVWNYLKGPTEIQSSIIAIILFVSLFVAVFKNEIRVSLEMLPYIALPIILFASINENLEFASNDMILCFSMFAATLLLFSQKEIYSKWLFRSMIICANLHLVIQVIGTIIKNYRMAVSTLFPLPNEITFFYMLVIFCSVFIFCKDSLFWKRYAAIIGILVFISICIGDIIYVREFRIGSEHALGIWLGLVCGSLFTAALFLWKKFSLPKNLAMFFAGILFLAFMFAPIIAVNSPFFSKDSMREATSRLDNWQAAWNLTLEKPLGVGFGAYGANIMQRWPTLEESYWNHKGVVYTSAHCQYLQILTEIGWIGFIYYCALFAIPWFISIFRYIKTGSPHFLFIAGMLAAMLSVMEVSEAMSMFSFIQIIYWMFLIYCVKALLPLSSKLQTGFTAKKHICVLFLVILLPLLSYLLFDRGKQLYSMSFSKPMELGYVHENAIPQLNKAREIHPKNASALWYTGFSHYKEGKYEEALKAMDAAEELSGYLLPVNLVRAEVYYEMGDLEKACEAAKFNITHFDDYWTLQLKDKLNCFVQKLP